MKPELNGDLTRPEKASECNWRARAVRVMAPVLLCLGIIGGCGGGEKAPDRADVLLEYGDSMLRKSDVIRRIPVGLEPADSAAMFRVIVEKWVENMLLSDMAEERIDNLDEIERKVEAYRRHLIVARYLRTVRDNGRKRADRDEVRAYYDAHASEMSLEAPLVKGIYVKVPSNCERLDDIRKWVKNASDVSVDNLEKYGLGQALQYDYFKDKWIDWQTIAEEIPYRISKPEEFLANLVAPSHPDDEKSGRVPSKGPAKGFFETEQGGAVYLLHISAWLPSGSEMPYSFASQRIAVMLEEQVADDYERRLVSSLYQKAKKEKKLRLISFDPALDKKKK